MPIRQYYSITTRRFIIQCNHEEFLVKTQELYNRVLLFYYNLYLEIEEQWGTLYDLNKQKVLRELEKLTIVGREKVPVPYPLPWEKIPLYFRRAAINAAAASAKSHLTCVKAGMANARTEIFCKGVTFYKGMYKELTEQHLSLKVWNGKEWLWIRCRLKGNFIPDGAQVMSPSVSREEKGFVLLVPVKENVPDGRKAKERMQEETMICSVQFGNGDSFAVGVVLNAQGEQMAVRFFKGGKEYSQRCSELITKINASQKATGKVDMGDKVERTQILNTNQEAAQTDKANKDQEEARADKINNDQEAAPADKVNNDQEAAQSDRECKNNRKYWTKLKHISDHHAHSISRQIIDFCLEKNVGIIVLPDYDSKFTKFVMAKAGNWSPLHLSRRIREMIGYKAWHEGMIVLEVNPGGTSASCWACGAPVRKKGELYYCPNGHQGNRQINTARNLGKKCLVGFGKDI